MLDRNLSKKYSKILKEVEVVSHKKDQTQRNKNGNGGQAVVQTVSIWEKAIENFLNPDIAEKKGEGTSVLFNQQPLLDAKDLLLPQKIDLYEGLDITEKDKIYVSFQNAAAQSPDYHKNVLLVNGPERIVGVFQLETVCEDGEMQHLLVADADWIDFGNHKSTKYFFAFFDGKKNLYRVPIEVSYQNTQTTSTHLCIDFGTSNTTAGCFLDEHYVDNISNLAILNGNVSINRENNQGNIVTFLEREQSAKDVQEILLHNLAPTVVYVDDCSNPVDIRYSFAYDATRRIKEDLYCPKASCFMEIKRWTSNLDVMEEIQDRDGNKATVARKEIISQYLMYIIRSAQNQFKCKFKNIHISAPVKLKDHVLELYSEILEKHGYALEKDHAIDEGIAVLYSIIQDQVQTCNYHNREEEKALIIDCGGGTSDLASCRYRIDKDEDGIINLDITTEYMNGDVNFGGNNLTYRIMQYMKIVYARQMEKLPRVNIDELITQDVNALFSYIEGELENDDAVKVKERYEEIYANINCQYQCAESMIPTRYKDFENRPKEEYDKVKNNFYFLWKLAEEMKKEFYKSTSISRYTYMKDSRNNEEIDLHVSRIESWRLSVMQKDGLLKEQDYPDITFTAKEIDKLLRADIYYLVRKFLNELYSNETLNEYSQIKLSGQSSKINIFMDSLKEFLPGKKIKSGRIDAKGNDAEELKLLCLKGAIMYLHALEQSNIDVSLKNEIRSIPISVFIKNENAEDKEMFHYGTDWEQPAAKRRITDAGKEIYLHMRNEDREIGEPYKYVYENMKYGQTDFDELKKISGNRIIQDDIDRLPANRKYIFVFLDKQKWGFQILPLYRDEEGALYKGKLEFCSFEMDILQQTFFDGRK